MTFFCAYSLFEACEKMRTQFFLRVCVFRALFCFFFAFVEEEAGAVKAHKVNHNGCFNS